MQKYFDPPIFVHKCEVLEGEFKEGENYTLRINVARRKDIARHHTATHLLDAALIKVLGKHVRQAGSLVEDSRLRFDFTHFAKLSDEEINRIELLVNGWIIENYPVKVQTMSLQEAINSGAIALFDEKYADTVRVVSVGDVSKELCGGTHVKHSGEIGFFKIISESALSRGIRRIEAKVALSAYDYIKQREDILSKLQRMLGVAVDELPNRVEELKSKKQKKQISAEFDKSKIRKVGELSIYTDLLENLDISDVRHIGDSIKAKMKSGVVLLFNRKEGKINLVVMVSDDLTGKVKANDIAKSISARLGGKGGGKAEFAQGGGRDEKALEYVMAHLEEFI